MSMSKYELQMLEEKRRQNELNKEKKKASIIISICFIVGLCALLIFVLKDKAMEAWNSLDNSLTTPIPQSKG